MGPGCTVGNGDNVLQNGAEKKYREDQGHGLHTRFHLGEVGGASVQATGNGKRRNVSGEEEVEGKLSRVRRDVSTIFPQKEHVKPTCHLHPPDEGGRQEGGGIKHIYSVLPQGNPVGKVPVTKLPCGSKH